MRSLRISLVLFAVLVGVIAVGTYYGRRVCDELQTALDAISDEPGEQSAAQTEQLLAYWKKQTPYLRPILNRTVVRTVSDLLSDMTVYAAAQDNAADFQATREKLYGAIDEMRRSEKATFGLWS